MFQPPDLRPPNAAAVRLLVQALLTCEVSGDEPAEVCVEDRPAAVAAAARDGWLAGAAANGDLARAWVAPKGRAVIAAWHEAGLTADELIYDYVPGLEPRLQKLNHNLGLPQPHGIGCDYVKTIPHLQKLAAEALAAALDLRDPWGAALATTIPIPENVAAAVAQGLKLAWDALAALPLDAAVVGPSDVARVRRDLVLILRWMLGLVDDETYHEGSDPIAHGQVASLCGDRVHAWWALGRWDAGTPAKGDDGMIRLALHLRPAAADHPPLERSLFLPGHAVASAKRRGEAAKALLRAEADLLRLEGRSWAGPIARPEAAGPDVRALLGAMAAFADPECDTGLAPHRLAATLNALASAAPGAAAILGGRVPAGFGAAAEVRAAAGNVAAAQLALLAAVAAVAADPPLEVGRTYSSPPPGFRADSGTFRAVAHAIGGGVEVRAYLHDQPIGPPLTLHGPAGLGSWVDLARLCDAAAAEVRRRRAAVAQAADGGAPPPPPPRAFRLPHRAVATRDLVARYRAGDLDRAAHPVRVDPETGDLYVLDAATDVVVYRRPPTRVTLRRLAAAGLAPAPAGAVGSAAPLTEESP